MKNKFYITTAIPYVNADPHIGFALELVQADAIARHRRQKGDMVWFLTGADENSLKNVLAAEKENISVPEFVNKNTEKFIKLCKVLNISNDDFIKTTESRHTNGAQKLWYAVKPEDLYKKNYKGLYCVGCEQFYTEKELVDGKCPEHLTVPEEVEEENYFFKLSNYQDKILELIESDKFKVIPQSKKNEMISFIKSGLEDFSISRSQKRARNWGIPVPNDDSQVMYVWFDALINYITGIGYADDIGKYEKYWPADVHVIGKGITRFHAIYWPAMLLSAGLPLPKTLYVHGYINADGVKMSKSLGNVIDPFKIIKKYGSEVTRYYLLRYMHPYEDSSFSEENLQQAYQSDLANGLGNLVSRVSGLIEQNDIAVETGELTVYDEVVYALNEFKFDQALKEIWIKIGTVDLLISESKPWEIAKTGNKEKVKEILNHAVKELMLVANNLAPFMPVTAKKIEEIFTAKKITKAAPLFPRLDV